MTAELPNSTSQAAAEGTVLHEIAALCLELGLDPYDFSGQTWSSDGFSFTLTDKLLGCMVPALDWLREQPGEFFIETKVSLDPWMADQFGTADVIILYFDGVDWVVVVFDWKFGAGVPVQVWNNKQLRAYGLGVLHTVCRPRGIEPTKFRLIIEQPRHAQGGNYGEAWEVSLADMLSFGEELRETMRQVEDPNAPLVASEEGCNFCAAWQTEAGCPAYDQMQLETFCGAFDDLDADEPAFPSSESLSPERRFYIVQHSKMATKWLAKLHEDSLSAALEGRPDPGSKAVAGRRGNRKFSDPDQAEAIIVEALGDDAYTRSLKPLTDIEVELAPKRGKPGDPEAWSALKALITQSEGKPILVPADDARPAITTTPIADEFDDLD